MLRIIFLASALLIITSCSNSVKSKLGLLKKGPDASVVSLHGDLIIPPILTELPEPKIK